MKQEEAIEDFKKLTYDLAKTISKLIFIKERKDYIVNAMDWDGLFEIDFSTALEKLASVQAAMVTYSYEDDYHESDLNDAKRLVEAYEK